MDYRDGEELSWCLFWSNSLWQGWSCRLVHCPSGNATDPIWRVLASSDGISSWTPLKPQHSIPCWLSIQWEPSACRSCQFCQKKGSSKVFGRCPWCSRYRRRKWTQWYEFKSWKILIAFSHSTNTLGEGMNPIILPPAMGK